MRLVAALAWRNLWRNGRRTGLTAGAIAFMVAILIFSLSMQLGSYDVMVDHATSTMNGHVQIQHPEYIDNPRVRYLLSDAEEIAAELRASPEIEAATTRAMSSALASVGERTFGALVLGVEPDFEPSVSWLPGTVTEGRYLGGAPGEAVIGEILARNLDVEVGDEIVLLGVTPEDGMAVLVADVVGLLASGQAALDRMLVQVPLALFQEAFEMPDAAHSVALMYADYTDADAGAQEVASRVADPEATVATWRRLMPEIEAAIASDKASAFVMYGVLIVLVTFSIANTFVMMIFERTREFGTLLALGARPGTLLGTVQLETLFLCLLGAGVGVLLGAGLSAWIGHIGISYGSEADELLAQFQMPSRIYFEIAWSGVLLAPAIMIVTTQAAAFFAGRRVRNMQIVEAVREEM